MALRAVATAGQPVPLGYVMAVFIGFWLYLRKSVANQTAWRFGFALLTMGLIAALSRGPWVGAAVMFLVFIATGPSPGQGLLKIALSTVGAMPLLMMTSAGQVVIDLLPFVGTVEEHNITYRQEFTEIAIGFILQHPLFGAYDYVYAPEMDVLKPQGLLDTLNVFPPALSNSLPLLLSLRFLLLRLFSFLFLFLFV